MALSGVARSATIGRRAVTLCSASRVIFKHRARVTPRTELSSVLPTLKRTRLRTSAQFVVDLVTLLIGGCRTSPVVGVMASLLPMRQLPASALSAAQIRICLLYTSDAADDLTRV